MAPSPLEETVVTSSLARNVVVGVRLVSFLGV